MIPGAPPSAGRTGLMPSNLEVPARRSRAKRLGALLALVFLVGCQPGAPAGPGPSAQQAATPLGTPWFEEGATAAGLTFRHRSGHDGKTYLLPEIVAGGVCLFDHDGDGHLDIYLVQSGSLHAGAARVGNVLYRNNGDRTFTDVTVQAGVGDTGYGMGCACADYDGDGNIDLYVTNAGPNVLYRNRGDGTFEDVSAASGTEAPRLSASAAFVDFDQDGHLDLFVTNYVEWSKTVELDCYSTDGKLDYCHPNNYRLPAPDILLKNRGDGTFVDVSEAAGLRAAFGNGMGIACADFDDDGRLDFYVANDSTANQLWIQSADGTFQDRALLAGVAFNQHGIAEAGMGVAAVDIDEDGRLDIFVTHLRNQSNTLYRNLGNGMFEDRSDAWGLTTASWPFTSFGLGFADFDHDGRLDLYIANGDVLRGEIHGSTADPYAFPNQVMRGSEGRFEEVFPRGGTEAPLVATSRGAAFGDLDGDGDVDAVVVNRDGPAHLLWNRIGQDRSWVRFQVLDRRGRSALHARVAVTGSFGTRWRTVDNSYSYCSSNEPTVHVGLGDATEVERVLVLWPDGTRQSYGPLPANAVHELRQSP